MPSKRLLYKGFSYVLAKTEEENLWELRIADLLEKLLNIAKNEDLPSHTKKENAAQLYSELRTYFKQLGL